MFRRHFVLGVLLSLSLLARVSPALVLDPGDFASLGEFSSEPGQYEIDTDTVEMTGPLGFYAAGVVSNGVAVFSFDGFTLGPGAGLTTTGALPAAILSNESISVGGEGIVALAGGGAGGEPQFQGQGPGGGFPGFDFFGGAGGGGGFGGQGGSGQLDDNSFSFPGAGGPSYGDLNTGIQGGSGGGGGKSNTNYQSAGGDGGGGIELAARFQIEITSSVVADGLPGRPLNFNHTGGGGGSGGGILLHAPSIFNEGLISASGGAGGDGVFENGGGGGGGRILIKTRTDGFTNSGLLSAAGGTAPSDFFGAGFPGQPGVIEVVTKIPEPASLAVVSGLLAAVCVFRSRQR